MPQIPQRRLARPVGRVGREPRRGILSVRGDGRGGIGHTQGVLRRYAVQRFGRHPTGQTRRLCPEPAH